jgi:uncharacterized membrane protein
MNYRFYIILAAIYLMFALFFTFSFIAKVIFSHAKITRGGGASISGIDYLLPSFGWALFFFNICLILSKIIS